MTAVLNTGLVLFFIGFPFASQYVRDRVKGFGFINPLIAAYIIGLILGNSILKGERFLSLLDGLATVSVLVSIPLMLFSLDLRTAGRTAGKALLGIVLAAVSILVTLVAAFFLFGDKVPDFPGVAGLLVAVYTGGTPNLAAIRTAIGVESNLFLAVHAADVLISALYVFFMITIAKRVLGLVLPSLPSAGNGTRGSREQGEGEPDDQSDTAPASVSFPLISEVFRQNPVRPILGALGLCLLIVGVSAGLSLLFAPEVQTMVVILVLTSLSIGAGMIPRIQRIKGSFELGEYAILIFALSAGAMGDFSRLLSASPYIFLTVAFAIFVSLILHIIFSRIAGIDVDTMMISSTAAICSPPFIGMVAAAMGNRRVIAPGIAAGLLGYAMGNYLGIGVYQLLTALN